MREQLIVDPCKLYTQKALNDAITFQEQEYSAFSLTRDSR